MIHKAATILTFITMWLYSSCLHAQTIELIVDQSQSNVSASILGVSDDSSITGTATIELTSDPSATAQITELNLVLADGFSISFLGFVSAVAEPDAVSVFFVNPGPAGAVSMDGQFDQPGNEVGFSGLIQINDPFNLVGGTTTINLDDEETAFFDIVEAQLTADDDSTTVVSAIDLEIPLVDTVVMQVQGTVRLTAMVGDVNQDNVISLLDVNPFVNQLISGENFYHADCNQDNAVDLLDVDPFINLLTGG